MTVRAVGYDGRRLAPGPADLQQWRERFARELRRLGVAAEATPRQARGTVRKAAPIAIHKAEERGVEPRVRRAERREAERGARSPTLPQPRDWSRDIQARQQSIRRAYLAHADVLGQGDPADRRLANDIRRFVADMPVPLKPGAHQPVRHAVAVAVELDVARSHQPARATGQCDRRSRSGHQPPEVQSALARRAFFAVTKRLWGFSEVRYRGLARTRQGPSWRSHWPTSTWRASAS